MLSVGDHDFSTSDWIVDEAVASLKRGRHHYSASGGEKELKQAVAAYHARCGMTVALGEVCCFPGSQCALFGALNVLLKNQGDEVLMLDPYYTPYPGTVESNRGKVVFVPMQPGQAASNSLDDIAAHPFRISEERLRAAITPRSRVIMANFPNNPTGTLINEEGIEILARVCTDYDLFLISDEVYAGLLFPDGKSVAGHIHRSPRMHPQLRERTIVLSSLSKTHAMTG